jgi:FkbM family methyltransferase
MKKIILDCGSHLGESVQKFRKMLPKTDEPEFYMFEANPYLFDRFNKNVEFATCKKYNVAISDKDSEVKFWGCVKNKVSVGSTLEKDKAIWDKIQDDDFLIIKSIRLSNFIKTNFLSTDYIILKLDIEGSEYSVLKDLIDSQCIDFINEIFCEFHSQWLPEEFTTKERQIKEALLKLNKQPMHWDALQ